MSNNCISMTEEKMRYDRNGVKESKRNLKHSFGQSINDVALQACTCRRIFGVQTSLCWHDAAFPKGRYLEDDFEARASTQ